MTHMKYKCKDHEHRLKADWRFCQRKRKAMLKRIEILERLIELNEVAAKEKYDNAKKNLEQMQNAREQLLSVISELRSKM